MSEQIVVTPKVGTIYTTLLTAGKYCDKDIFVDLYPLVAHEQETALAAGIQQGKTEGKEEAYNAFWNVFQDNGARTDYKYAFRLWDDDSYNPKYAVVIAGDGSYAYTEANITKRVDVETSGCTKFDGMFSYSKITEIGTVDTTGCPSSTTLAGIFNHCTELVKVEELALKDDGSQKFSTTMFLEATNLQYIRISGTIGDSLTMANCSALTKESVTSIIGALSPTASGKTLTLHSAVKNNFTSGEWTDLKNTKSNWTIKPD